MTARKEKRRSTHDPLTTWTDNASALAFVVAGSYWGQTDGQVMYILAISLAAAEASIGLALLLQLHRRRQNLNIDSVSEMRG